MHPPEKPGSGSETGPAYGFSARFYDHANDVWRAVLLWPDPGRSEPYQMVGHVHHGRAEFFRTLKRDENSDLLVRFTFSDMGPNRIRWDSAIASETWSPIDFDNYQASTWFTETKFEFSRVGFDTRDVDNDSSDPVCTENDIVSLEAVTGQWRDRQGERFLTLEPIVGKCGWVFRIEDAEARNSHYVLLAYNTRDDHWSSYHFRPGQMEYRKAVLSRGQGKKPVQLSLGADISLMVNTSSRPDTLALSILGNVSQFDRVIGEGPQDNSAAQNAGG